MADFSQYKTQFTEEEWERVLSILKRTTAGGYVVEDLIRLSETHIRIELIASIAGAVKDGHTVGMLYRI